MAKSQSILDLCRYAENVWHRLHGVIGIYKPAGEHVRQVAQTLKSHICRDLNKLEVRPPINHVWIEGETNKPMTVAVGPSYADHPLLVGPRYQLQDVRTFFVNRLERDSSGILLCGINAGGIHSARLLQESRPIKIYRVKGVLGKATDNYFSTGKVVEKSTFKHVRREHIDKIVAAMQSSHQKKMFDVCGISIQSQAAYEMAVQGPIRPTNTKIPMIYSIKCIDFQSPVFTLEIVCIHEDEMYLKTLCHDLGYQVRSTGHCSQIHCVRCGLFTLDHALLKKHWDLERIVTNMAQIRNIIKANKFIIKQKDPILKEYSEVKQIQSPALRIAA